MTHNQNIVYEDDDEDEDDTLTDNHNEFSGIEMSQDCIAWDESNNRDLRASFSNKTTTAGPTGVMDHLKTGSGAVTGNHKNHTANDQEIAGIFSVLGPGKEATTRILPTTNKSFHASTTSSCASEFAAPLRRRNLNQSVRHSFPPNANNDRKRPDFGRSNHARKKLPKRSISGSVPSSRRDNLSPAPLHSSNSSHRVSNSTTTPQHIPGFAALDSSGFDDLLEQMKTPSPAHFAATAETSTAAPQTSTKKNEHSSWTTNNHSNEGQQEASTSTTRTRHHARNNNNANSYQHSTTTMKPKALDVEAFQKSKPVQDKENANASQFISKKTTNNGQRHLKQPLGQNIHKSNSTMNKQTPTSSTTTATTTNTMPPPAAVPSMKQKAAAPSNPLQPAKHQTQSTVDFSANLEEEDEFGDFDFSQVDFDQVDSLVAATQQEQKPVARTTNNTIAAQKNMSADREPLPTPSTVTPPQREEPRPPIVSSHDPAPAATSTSNSGGKNSSPDFLKEQNTIDPLNDDSFGDFPDDIDFDALDAAIATQMPYADHTHQSGPSTCISNGPESNTTAMGQHPMQTTATTTMYQIPPVNAPFRNPRMDVPSNGLTFTRYKVRMVESDAYSFTKTLFVEEWNTSMLQEERLNSIHRISDSSKGQQCDHGAKENSKPLLLRGSMYYIQVEEGDVLHLCSLTGRFKTDPSALPVILNTTPPTGSDEDDLVMILHPDMLSTPTGVTKMLACGRRAVVTSRLGSNGMSSKKMLFGTMRHSLFEVTLRERNFSSDFVRHHIKVIVRKNAEAMISCNMSSSEAEGELFKIFPQLQAFEREYFNPQRPAFLQGNCGQQGINIKFAAKSVAGVEEPVIAPELGLKGNLDVIVDADIGRTGPGATGNTENALMGIELKTNHNTNSQVEHMAQLGLYTMMLLSRFGKTNSAIFKEDPKSHEAISGGMLLYLNGETLRAEHISPNIPDIKNLIEHRNIHSSDYTRTLKPRGVKLIYESEGTDPRYVNFSVSSSFVLSFCSEAG